MTEGVRSDVGRLERMKRGRGMKDREQRSRGMETLIVEALAKIKPIDPLRLVTQAARLLFFAQAALDVLSSLSFAGFSVHHRFRGSFSALALAFFYSAVIQEEEEKCLALPRIHLPNIFKR